MPTRLQNVVNSLIETIIAYELHQKDGKPAAPERIMAAAQPLYAIQGDDLAHALVTHIKEATARYTDRRPLLVYMAAHAVYLKSLTSQETPLDETLIKHVGSVLYQVCISLSRLVNTIQEEDLTVEFSYELPHLAGIEESSRPKDLKTLAIEAKKMPFTVPSASSASSSTSSNHITFLLKGCDRSKSFTGEPKTVAGYKIIGHFQATAGLRQTLYHTPKTVQDDIAEIRTLVQSLCRKHQRELLRNQQAASLKHVQAENTRLMQENGDLLRECAAFRESLAAEQAKSAKLAAEKLALQESWRALSEQIAVLSAEKATLTAEKSTLAATLEETGAKLNTAQHKNTEYRLEVERLMIDNSELINRTRGLIPQERPSTAAPITDPITVSPTSLLYDRNRMWPPQNTLSTRRTGTPGLRVMTESPPHELPAAQPPSPFFAGFDGS